MTFTVRIRKQARGQNAARTLVFKHFRSFPHTWQMPVMVMPLPEAANRDAIHTKVEGNTYSMKFTVKVIPLLDTESYVEELQGYNNAWKLRKFIQEEFQADHVDDEFKITAGDGDTYDVIEKGTINHIDLGFSEDDPTNGNLTISFIVGDVVYRTEDDD